MTETLTRTHSILRPVENGPIVHAWDHGVPIEPDVWKQVAHLASVPGVERIAIMPDAHIGKGACVGSAILTREIVIPAAVGVDIGCGMIAAPLSVHISRGQPQASQRLRYRLRLVAVLRRGDDIAGGIEGFELS